MTVHAFTGRAGRAPRPHHAEVDLQRLPMRDAAPWQAQVMEECRRLGKPCADVFAWLKAAGLHRRCVLLAAGPGERLRFRFIGEPTVRVLGAAWARRQLGQTDADDPHRTMAAVLGVEYREALDAGPIVNRVTLSGLSASPLVYTHALVGWRLDTGHRAVLSLIEAPTLH